MREKTMNTVHTLAKVCHILAKICNVLVWIALVMAVILTVIVLAVPKLSLTIESYNQSQVRIHLEGAGFLSDLDWEAEDGGFAYNDVGYTLESVEQNGSEIDAYATTQPYVRTITLKTASLILPLIVGIASITVSLFCLHYFKNLCRLLRYCMTPFTDEIAQLLQKIAYWLIPMLVLDSVGDSALSNLMSGKVGFSLNVNLEQAIIVIAMFLVAAVFKYGTMLQKNENMVMQQYAMYMPVPPMVNPPVMEPPMAEDSAEETKNDEEPV